MVFDAQPCLEGASLSLRPLQAGDRVALFEAASDPATWAGHPVKNRHERPVFDRYFDFLLNSGTTLLVTDRVADRVIGCSRYYVSPDRPGTVAIGFTFLNPDYWGGETNFELKTLMFEHVFKTHDELWLDIGPSNIRSQKASAKVGAIFVYAARLDFGTGEDDYLCYRVTKERWAEVKAARA